jgi:hypothetical protein
MTRNWRPIHEPYVYGVQCEVGNRRVEVVRTDSCTGAWTWFAYLDGRMVVMGPKPPTDRATAIRDASRWLTQNPKETS